MTEQTTDAFSDCGHLPEMLEQRKYGKWCTSCQSYITVETEP